MAKEERKEERKEEKSEKPEKAERPQAAKKSEPKPEPSHREVVTKARGEFNTGRSEKTVYVHNRKSGQR